MRERINPVQIFDEQQQRSLLAGLFQAIFQQDMKRGLPIFWFQPFGKAVFGNGQSEQAAE